MNLEVLRPEVRAYLMEHLHEPAVGFLLKSHPFDVDAKDLVQQLVGLQKARTKFPLLFENDKIVYPLKTNLEQTSSEATASYKASLVKGNSMIDLTGGLGVDVIAFAKAYPQTNHVESNASLQEIASHNFGALGLSTKSTCGDGIAYLKTINHQYDLIYLDPSRKTVAISKAILLYDYEPNVLENIDLLFEKSNTIMIKTSPMLDITAGLSQLGNVVEIHIVAVKNEVKELLWVLSREVKQLKLIAVNLETDQPIFAVIGEQPNELELSTTIGEYLYEPNAAIMKSQAFAHLSQQYNIQKIDQDAHLFTSNDLIDFPGRVFRVNEVLDYKPKMIKRRYGKSARAIVARNFRESVKQLRTRFTFTESESDYLFFTSIAGRGAVVIDAKKVA